MSQSILVRAETADDLGAVRRINEQAFDGAAEAELVDALRRRGAVTLSLVAEIDGEVVGHILFSPATIVSDGEQVPAVALAPMAVMPTHQRRGVGSRLVDEGLRLLSEAGHGIVVVLGHANYYPRFGFRTASELGIGCSYDVPDEVFMVRLLRENAWSDRTGTVRYRAEFDSV